LRGKNDFKNTRWDSSELCLLLLKIFPVDIKQQEERKMREGEGEEVSGKGKQMREEKEIGKKRGKRWGRGEKEG
jgi:hypothetical protein